MFYEEYFISSTLPHEVTRILYNYIVGTNDVDKEKRKNKIFGYKPASTLM